MWVYHHCLSLTSGYSCVPSSWVDLAEYLGTLVLVFAAVLGTWAGLYAVMGWLAGHWD